jgi:hypothetical protein
MHCSNTGKLGVVFPNGKFSSKSGDNACTLFKVLRRAGTDPVMAHSAKTSLLLKLRMQKKCAMSKNEKLLNFKN